MYVESLALERFRNYEGLELRLDPGINIFYGDNAQGKTNILEALYLGATTKSHRGAKDREMIGFGCEDAHLRLMVSRDQVSHKIDMHLKKSKAKGIAVDGIPIKRSGELFGLINMICFSPEDLSMIKNGPAERRHFLDMEMCQLSQVYLHDISAYNRIVNQRNNLLKQISMAPELKDTLDVWDMQLAEYGRKVILAREAFMQQLNDWVRPVHEKLTGGLEQLTLVYQPSVAADDIEQRLFFQRENDLRLRSTGVGPHRDDFLFMVGDVDIRKYGSQGQQRTAALSLKMAEIELVGSLIQDKPVLLLDDVLSELDSSRQNYLLECIKDIQTIITCTGLDEFVGKRFEMDRIYKVAGGHVTEMNQ